jgi:predicted nuclease of predicted toxin-antitoxin system
MSDPERRVFWVDENLPPALGKWLTDQPGLRADHFRRLGLQETPDREIFLQAREAGAIIVTKDDDFANLVTTQGSPPQIVWVRTGNIRTVSLLELFRARLAVLLEHVDAAEPLIAIE